MHTTLAKQRQQRRRQIWIAAGVGALSLGFLAIIFGPRLLFWLFPPGTNRLWGGAANSGTAIEAKGNRLIIDKLGVNAEIVDGKNLDAIEKQIGVWRESQQTEPGEKGNVVLAGHRFQVRDLRNNYFYNLPDLQKDDELTIKWNDQTYRYRVYETKTVEPTQIDIRNPTKGKDQEVTLYTCTPLGSTAQRFVIKAEKI